MMLALIVGWAIEGNIATTATGQGVIVREGAVLSVVSRAPGMVYSLDVKVGQHVKANQTIAKIAMPTDSGKVALLEEGLEQNRRELEQGLSLRKTESQLQVEAIERQKAATAEQIKNLQEQVRLGQDRVKVLDQLLAKGLVTQQATVDAKEKVLGFQLQIEQAQAQLKQADAQASSARFQVDQTESQNRLKISDLERSLAQSRALLHFGQTVSSPYAGEVLEVRVSPGDTVAEGSPILTIQPEVEALETVIYIGAEKAKDVHPGMQARISPSVAKPEEFGYMTGKVVAVADYPTTPAALMREFQNDSLVQALTRSGPVTEIRITLDADASTRSGFHWSSSKGPPVRITSGTLCSSDIVTLEQRPIDLVLPYLKDKLGVS